MTSTHRLLCVVFLLGFAACDSDKTSGTGGVGGGTGTGGGGGKAGGGNGGGGSGAAGGAGGKIGPVGGAGGGGGNGAGGGGTAGSAGGSGGGGGSGGSAGGTAGSAGGTAGGGKGGGGNGGGGNGAGGNGGAGGHAGCTFSATYTVNDEGGIAAFVKKTILSPPAMFEYQHQNGPSGPTQSCHPALPACGSPTKVDASDVEAAMANADVQAAFAATTEPFYGDRAVADGPSFEVVRSTGGKLLVGLECTPASATCTPTPAGVHTMVHLLQDLIAQQIADPSCM